MCLWINNFCQIICSFFLLTDFNRLAELLTSCTVFQKCDAMADLWNTGHEINNLANLLKSVNRKNELIIWEKNNYP